MISRRAPEISSEPSGPMLGFAPVLGAHMGHWLSISKGKKMLSLMDGETTVESVTVGEGVDQLKVGSYQLQHKQRNPLWYAPDHYFASRKLPVPAEGDKNRFRRGALGDFVLFLTKDTPIHSGPVWSEDVGGVRIDESELSKIYYSIDVGSVIEVK